MIRNLTITPVLNGYIVQAGCQQVVFQSAEQMLGEIGKYLANPSKVEAQYLAAAVNKPAVPDIGRPAVTAYPTVFASGALVHPNEASEGLDTQITEPTNPAPEHSVTSATNPAH